MKSASEDGRSGLILQAVLSVVLFLAAIVFIVRAGNDSPVAASTSATSEQVATWIAEDAGVILTNTQQLAGLFQQGYTYPEVWGWQPMMFEPVTIVWADTQALPKELLPVQDSLSQLVYGIPAWPLWLTLSPQDNDIVVFRPWSDEEMARLTLPKSFPAWEVYDQVLYSSCILSGINPTNWETLVKQGYTQFGMPQVVLHAWLADIRDAPMYYANLAAEVVHFEAALKLAAPTVVDEWPEGGRSMLLTTGSGSGLCGRTIFSRLEAVTNDFVLEWFSETNATYEIVASSDLTTNAWVQLATRYPAAANTNLTSYTDVGGATNELRFYKVAETGITIAMCDSNMVGGVVEVPVQVGMPDSQRLEGVYFWVDGEPSASIVPPAHPFGIDTHGIWNTTSISNGWHTLQAFAVYRDSGQDGAGGYSAYGSQLVTVETSNPIVFTYPVSTFGTTMVVQAFIATTNADWTVTINSPSNVVLRTFSGTTSNSTVEVFWDGKDTNGVQFADQFVQVQLTAISQVESGFAPLQLTTITNSAGTVIYAEGPMKPFPQNFLVSYQLLFNEGSLGAIQFENMINQIAVTVEDQGGGTYVLQGDSTGVAGTTKIDDTTASWTSWVNSLLSAGSVFYFGHGSHSSLGSDPSAGKGAYVDDLGNFLVNGYIGSALYFLRPFRFVFLDGCNTSDGYWSVAFGIERKHITTAQYTQNGLRPRAFMGFRTVKVYKVSNQFAADHSNFVLGFFTRWSTGQTLQAAVSASLPSGFTAPVVWGDDQLTWTP